MTRTGGFNLSESQSVSRSQPPVDIPDTTNEDLSTLEVTLDAKLIEVTARLSKLERAVSLLNRKSDHIIGLLSTIRDYQTAQEDLNDTVINGDGTEKEPYQVIEVGDEVRSTTKPFHHGVVTRFSKDHSFAFIRTKSGKEESKSPRNLVVIHNGES